MKKYVLIILIMFGTAGTNTALGDIIPESPDVETIPLTMEQALELWGATEEDKEPDNPDRAWDAWGFEKRDKETGEAINRNLTFFAYLEQTSERVWRSGFMRIFVPSGVNSIREFCKANEYTVCERHYGTKSYVLPKGEEPKFMEDFSGSDFKILTSIEEFRLVWLVDFLSALKSAEKGEEVKVDDIVYQGWPREGEIFNGYEEWASPEKDYSIIEIMPEALTGKPWGYRIIFCEYLEDLKRCDPYGYLPTISVYFISPKEVRVEFALGLF